MTEGDRESWTDKLINKPREGKNKKMKRGDGGVSPFSDGGEVVFFGLQMKL